MNDDGISTNPFENNFDGCLKGSYESEWYGYWLMFSQLFVLAIIFIRMPVNDALYEFFSSMIKCQCCCNNDRNKDTQRHMEMGMYRNDV